MLSRPLQLEERRRPRPVRTLPPPMMAMATFACRSSASLDFGCHQPRRRMLYDFYITHYTTFNGYIVLIHLPLDPGSRAHNQVCEFRLAISGAQ